MKDLSAALIALLALVGASAAMASAAPTPSGAATDWIRPAKIGAHHAGVDRSRPGATRVYHSSAGSRNEGLKMGFIIAIKDQQSVLFGTHSFPVRCSKHGPFELRLVALGGGYNKEKRGFHLNRRGVMSAKAHVYRGGRRIKGWFRFFIHFKEAEETCAGFHRFDLRRASPRTYSPPPPGSRPPFLGLPSLV
jgi:hypothetical protein